MIGTSRQVPALTDAPQIAQPTYSENINPIRSYFSLKLVTVADETTVSGREFQTLTRNKINDYFESLEYRRTCLSLPITRRENTSLAVQVVQKIAIIRAQKIGKFTV